MRRGGFAYMQTWQDGPDTPPPVLVKFYRAAPTSKPYLDWTTFRSGFYSNYDAQRIEDCDCCHYTRRNAPHTGVGMQMPFGLDECGCPRDFPYASNAAPACFTGQEVCGSPQVFRDGGVFGVDPAFAVPESLIPECCDDVCTVGEGGDADGGTAVQGSRPGLGGIGGDEDGGSAFVNTDCFLWFGYSCPSLGGDADGGTAPQVGFPGWVAVGGDVDNSEAEVFGGYFFAALGGDVDGGIASQEGGTAGFGLGGDVDGGLTEQAGGGELLAIGGDLDGGHAPQSPYLTGFTITPYTTTTTTDINQPVHIPGDVAIVIGIIPSETITMTPPAGWTLLETAPYPGALNMTWAVWYHVMTALDPALWTWTLSASVLNQFLLVNYTMAAPPGLITDEYGNSNTPSNTGCVAPTDPWPVVLYVVTTTQGTFSGTEPTDYDLVAPTSGSVRIRVWDSHTELGATGTISNTISAVRSWVTLAFALGLSGVTPPPPPPPPPPP